MQPNFSQVVIYNLNAETENQIINEDDRIIVEAGYEGEQYGLIFDGDIIQTIREKEDGVTYKLTLIAQDGNNFFRNSYANTTLQKGQTNREIINTLTTQSSIPTTMGNISDNLDQVKLTRGKAIFGLTVDYLRQLAKSQNATFYLKSGEVNIVKLEDIPQGEIIDLSPTSGLIGVPSQTDQGVTIKSLLNPNIKTNILIHIDNRLVRQMQYPLVQVNLNSKTPSTPVIRNLDNDGIYRVIKVTYKGDTRGDDWTVEAECIVQSGLLPTIATTNQTQAWT
jgi:hypothetical protein